ASTMTTVLLYSLLSTLLPFFSLTLPRPPTSTLFPYTTLFRSRNRDDRRHPIDSEPQRRRDAQHRRHDAPGHGDRRDAGVERPVRSEEHTSELQSRSDLVCRLLLEKKKKKQKNTNKAKTRYIVQ